MKAENHRTRRKRKSDYFFSSMLIQIPHFQCTLKELVITVIPRVRLVRKQQSELVSNHVAHCAAILSAAAQFLHVNSRNNKQNTGRG